ncbi:MAG: metal-dependent hydrolase [Candidatus Helarchaeota archaeon]
MPDWLTHFFLGYIIIWGFSKFPKYDNALRKYYWFFIIGMLEPDIERIFSIIANQTSSALFIEISAILTGVFHSILGVFIISLFITSFFPREKDTKFIFLALFIGGIGHLLTDAIMWPWKGMGINFLYPLNGPEFAFSFHLVWPGGLIPLIVTSSIVLGTVIFDLITQNFSVFQLNFGKDDYLKGI